MKTILLTSGGMDVKEEILKILPKPPNQIKLAHIITAATYKKDKSYVAKDTKVMERLGFQVTEVDVKGMRESEVRNLLENKDIVYVQGGSTHFLLKCVKESGFDKVVRDLIETGVVYIGASAGSYITGPSIEQVNGKEKHDTHGLTGLSAMNLVPFMLYVHYVPKFKDLLERNIPKSKYDYKILTDDQALLVRDGDYKLVGKGPEIKL